MLLRFLCLSFLAAAFVAAAPARADDTDAIVVGQVIDLSSPNANIGRDYVAGIKTYFDGLNAAGGINGRHIRYIVKDDQGVPALAAKAATELIERDQADFLFGGVGDDVMQAILNAPAFQRSKLMLYAPLADAQDTVDRRVLFWRPPYASEVDYILRHFSQLGMTDVGIAWQDTPGGKAALQRLLTEVQARGMKLSGTARIGSDDARTAQEITRLAQAQPGFVIVVADTFSTAQFLKTFRKSAPQTFVAGTSLTNLETLLEIVGPRTVDWTVFSQVVPNPNNGNSVLQREHMAMIGKYRDEPASSLTLEGYAAAKTLAKAIQRAHHPRSALQELVAQDATIDLGGLVVVATPNGNHLSGYLDIALFDKGALMF